MPLNPSAGRPSSLPQQIPPQTARLGTTADQGGNVIGNVTMDVNWWLFFYNIAQKVLTASGAPIPLSAGDTIALVEAQDIAGTDALQAHREVINAMTIEANNVEVASVDAIDTKRAVLNALAMLLTDQNVTPIIELSADVTGVLQLNRGGTGDGSTFSWTGGSTKKLIANTIQADGSTALALLAVGVSIAASLKTSVVAGSNSGQVSLASGDVSAGGSSGNIQSQSGSVTSGAGTSGNISFSSGSTQSAASGGLTFGTGSSVSGPTGAISINSGASSSGIPGGVSISVGTSTSSGSAQNDVTIFAGASAGAGSSGATRIQTAGGGAGTDAITVTDSAAAGSYAPELAFYGVTPVVRPATGGAAATFVQSAGNAVNDASTFDGYTLKQVVKALRNLGLLT